MPENIEEQVFIPAGRQAYLDQLVTELDRVLVGAPRIVLVTGEAGIGKTSLLHEFCRQAQERNEKLIVAWGRCSAVMGLGDPYQPFKDIMGLLTGDVTSARSAQLVVGPVNAQRLREFLLMSGEVLLEVGGDLLDIFVPGAALLARAVSIVGAALNIGWIEKLKKRSPRSKSKEDFRPEQLFEQYYRVLMRLAEKRPLLLVIDDLHWADAGTMALLFHLSRRFQECERLPLLLVGTYRPIEFEQVAEEEVGSLFSKIVSEVRRYGRDVVIDLSSTLEWKEGYAFVDAYLDTEPNRLGEEFRNLLARRSGGHPLFTVELLRMLQERGILARDLTGRWFMARPIELEDLPDKVEAVLAERIRRLEDELREILECGSVEGEEFTAQVVAQIKEMQERDLIRQLGKKLERDARLIRASESVEVNHRRLHRFRFRHALLQVYLYQSLSLFEKELLHGDVGEALETLYGSESRQVAGQLARHFEFAHMSHKAIAYYKLAGDHARGEFANGNAVELYTRALGLLPDREDSEETRFEILSARERAYDSMGKRDEQRADLESLLVIAEKRQKPEWLASVQNSFAKYYERTGDYQAAVESARKALDAARGSEDSLLECESWLRLAWAYYWISSQDAIEHSRFAVETARRAGSPWFEARALDILGLNCREMNDYAAAQEHLVEAQRLARETGDRWCELDALDNLSIVSRDIGDYAASLEYGRQALNIARAIGDRWAESDTLYDLIPSLYRAGRFGEALHQIEEALKTARAIDYRWAETNLKDVLGEVYTLLGSYSTAHQYLKEAESELPALQDAWVIARNQARLGRLYCEQGDTAAALSHLERALTESRRLGWNRIIEASALDGMGRVFEQTGHLEDAEQSFAEALSLAVDLGRHFIAADARAGAARVALARGDLDRARQLVADIMAWIAAQGVEALEDPAWVCFSCAQVLQANGELERAWSILDEGYRLLMERANGIDDPALRSSYLENVRSNRELVRAWQQWHEPEIPDS